MLNPYILRYLPAMERDRFSVAIENEVRSPFCRFESALGVAYRLIQNIP
jgi:hypothetical protein